MKNPTSLFKLLMALLLVSLLAACGGSDGPTEEPTPPEPEEPEPEPEPEEPVDIQEPRIFNLTSNDGRINLSFTHRLLILDEPPEITFDLYYAREKFEIDLDEDGNFEDEDMTLEELEERFENTLGATLLEDVESPLEITGLENNTIYYLVLTATTEEDGTSHPTDEFRATPRDYSALAVSPYVLNDTGKTTCGDFSFNLDVNGNGSLDDPDDIRGSGQHNNQIDCVNGEADPQNDLVPEPSEQDAYQGRDYLAQTSGLAKEGAGMAGFDFTKLDANGNELADDAAEWSCVQDNHTGLVWEVKKTEGLHNGDDRYSWYNQDIFSNGGFEGYKRAGDLAGAFPNDTCFGFVGGNEPTYCNSAAFIDRVNGSALCGANDWRLPTREELMSIVNFELENINEVTDHLPSLDPNYFPNIDVSTAEETVRYMTADPYAEVPVAIWSVYMGSGGFSRSNKAQPSGIMLVREP